MARSILLLLALAACGDDGGHPATDANPVDVATGDGPTCSMGSVDKPAFWPTLCAAADRCGWLTPSHPELETSEATCNTRYASEPDPSTQLAYLSGMESRIHAAAACLGCQNLIDAYFRPDLETVFCAQLVRCGFATDAACRMQYEADAARPGTQAKFDYACPRYCLEQLSTTAACTEVMACLTSCS